MSKRNFDNVALINNEGGDKKRFELPVDDKVAYVEYMVVRGNVMYLTHTEVPIGFEGQGVGSALIGKVLTYIRENDLLMAPICPFLASYLKKHPEQAKGILAPGFNIA